MSIRDFLKKQFIDVIHWTEPEDGILAQRYAMRDMEIQNGGQLTVRESQMAAFVNEGRIADIFGPGLYTLSTKTMPLMTNLMNWDKMFQSPFKSDVYFFSTRQQTDQRWGTQNPITIRDKDFGAVRIRGYGIYSWHLADPRTFHTKLSGTKETYHTSDLEGQLRNSMIGWITDAIASSGVPFLDMASNQMEMAEKLRPHIGGEFGKLGLELDSFVIENVSLPEELQKRLDERIGMNMIGDMGRYTQFQVAQSMPIAAANEGGIAGIGAGLGAGMLMAQQMGGALGQGMGMGAQPPQPQAAPGVGIAPAPVSASAPATPAAAGQKFCIECGKPMPGKAKFCPECGGAQQ